MNDTETAQQKARAWLYAGVDDTTAEAIHQLLGDDAQLKEAFLNDLEFGTGGLRGIMGVGTARISRYTIGMATQGLASYLMREAGADASAAIAYDSRHRSRELAEVAAQVLSANGIAVYLSQELRPTPWLSFAVRHLKCTAGIVITASHNPPEYNGYKVYWSDGGQILPPHDKGIITEVRNVKSLSEVNFNARTELIHSIGADVDEAYLKQLAQVQCRSASVNSTAGLRIVYTPIHGTGITMVPRALERAGFSDVKVAEAQAKPDGAFPTVHSPNPEEKSAMQMALQLGHECGAQLVLGTDPDADRVGVAARNDSGELALLNGNQTGALITWHMLSTLSDMKKLPPNAFVAKTIVTTDLVADIARHFGVAVYETLTGFKYIAGLIAQKEGREKFICGGEESYGYMVGDFVRDKDAVSASVIIAEMAAQSRQQGLTLWQLLSSLYSRFGYYHDELISITLPGLDGVQQIAEMMHRFRQQPLTTLGGVPVNLVRDFKLREVKALNVEHSQSIELPSSDVLQYELMDGSKVTMRPSGTEPKIKFYISLKSPVDGSDWTKWKEVLAQRAALIRKELKV